MTSKVEMGLDELLKRLDVTFGMSPACDEAAAAIRSLRQDAARLREFLRTANDHIYGGLWIDHSVDCTLGTTDTAPCTCGLSDWIRDVQSCVQADKGER